MLLVRYGKLQLAFAKGWEEQYQIKPVEPNPRARVKALVAEDVVVEDEKNDEIISESVRKKAAVKANPKVETSAVKAKTATKKSTTKPKTPKQ
jgi:hypothetical protein